MEKSDGAVARRTVVKLAGFGITALASNFAVAAETGASNAQGERPWSAEYSARKGDVKLAMYRRRLKAPVSGETPPPVLFFAHGSSLSARPSFDLVVPGAGEYSLMNVFARLGYDVWTMDFAGYGRSVTTAGNSNIADGVEDLKAAVAVMARETGRKKFHFYGGSSGALRIGAFAMQRPDSVDRLVLESVTYTGEGSPTLNDRAKQVEYYRTHNRRPRDRDMIRSIFTRDKPGTSDSRVAEAMADVELKFGDTIPTGTYLDMTANLPVIDPAKITAPVLIVRGEYDGIATEADVLDFYRKLPNPDRQFSLLAGAAHAVALGLNRRQLWHVMHAFLDMPPRVDA